MLKIEGLYKAFKDKKVLEGLDLVLNEVRFSVWSVSTAQASRLF